jgi:hypothetical protein
MEGGCVEYPEPRRSAAFDALNPVLRIYFTRRRAASTRPNRCAHAFAARSLSSIATGPSSSAPRQPIRRRYLGNRPQFLA